MEERNLSNWSDYKNIVDEIRTKYGYFEGTTYEDWTIKYENRILFRGQPNKRLKTSLERATSEEFSLSRYLLFMNSTVHEVESHTGFNWNLPNGKVQLGNNSANQLSGQYKLQEEFRFPQNYYPFAIYLRHYGYPSPLLDWTASPYIAAYFALCDHPQEGEDRVAVYTYIEMLEGVKAVYNPRITVLGPKTTTHKRHFAQKAWYTIAAKWEEKSSDYIFCSHHNIFDEPPKNYDPKQDFLIKITIPVSERSKALKELDNDFNINHFTLFQTEDSLIKTLRTQQFVHQAPISFIPKKSNK